MYTDSLGLNWKPQSRNSDGTFDSNKSLSELTAEAHGSLALSNGQPADTYFRQGKKTTALGIDSIGNTLLLRVITPFQNRNRNGLMNEA